MSYNVSEFFSDTLQDSELFLIAGGPGNVKKEAVLRDQNTCVKKAGCFGGCGSWSSEIEGQVFRRSL